ncbi:Hpt domain-containing protein [Arthrobacter sp. CAN_A1]|uniref:Hpt domain-containing protein n=1 Tax=Arthrobacter sp. CAN_A1 TaxID=2787717 RepID=UPI0018CBC364
MIDPPRRRVPLVDQDTLRALGDQLENPSAVKTFVADFIQVWDERYLKLADTVERRDRDAALEAVLSVRTTSTMVGAARLANLAANLEELIRLGDMDEAVDALPFVQACGLQTIRELILCSESAGE